MALNASGPISLAGSTTGQSIAIELGLSATGQISLNDAAVRGLAGVLSGAIVMPTDFYGKSNAPIGSLYAWGTATNGALGTNSINSVSSPVQIGAGNTNWYWVAEGYQYSFATTYDRKLWSWGRGNAGGTGQNITANISSPTQVGALTNWKIVAQKQAGGLCVKTDGTLWAWGFGNNGQIGDNTTNIDRSSPVQIGALTTWATPGRGCEAAVFCIRTNGTLWAWGGNNYGVTGLNFNYNPPSSPTQVGALTGWTSVSTCFSSSIGIQANKLYSWGNNAYGVTGRNLGSGRSSSPVQVGALTNWQDAIIATQNAFAIKTDGTLWAWGRNIAGGLGLGTGSGAVSSPTQIGALTTWEKLGGHSTGGIAIKTDGTFWNWGGDGGGVLGKNTNNVPVSSPIQLGAETDWKFAALSTNANRSFGIR